MFRSCTQTVKGVSTGIFCRHSLPATTREQDGKPGEIAGDSGHQVALQPPVVIERGIEG